MKAIHIGKLKITDHTFQYIIYILNYIRVKIASNKMLMCFHKYCPNERVTL